jgi:drug/metabolite transporter (DMT)-like permease
MKSKFKGSIYLLLATFIWGTTFIAQSVGMDHIGPFTFQAVRCGLAVIGLLPVIWLFDRKSGSSFRKGWQDKNLWKAGIFCGIPLFLACDLQQIGIIYTTAGKAAFLTAMYIVLVPVFGLLLRRRITFMVPISVGIAVVGLYLLSFAGVSAINIGDILLLGSAMMFAVQILCVDHFAARVDPLRLNCLQAGVCAVGSALVALFAESVTVADLLGCWFPLCYAGFLSMGLAYSMQILGQKHLEPAVASLIMSLESVFAVLAGWLLLKETMTTQEATGCVLMFVAVILSQIPVKTKERTLQ